MAFVKNVKGTPYFKRFQTKYRRRREGKTDYYARKRLIIQDKDKYNSPKYRFVVRFTNQKIICQIAYATIKGDKILNSASSDELRHFGLTAGLTNYASAYATGLLLSRRLLKQLGMDKLYPGNTKIDGSVYDVGEKPNEERRPFLAYLDVGLTRTTIGNRVFGALKGACDGGLYIPHSNKRFPGFHESDDKEQYDAKVHRDRIFGVHVDKYYNKQKKELGKEDFSKLFSKWEETLTKSGVKSIEELYKKVHEAIRKDCDRKKRGPKKDPKRDHTKYKQKRLTKKQRLANVQKRLAIMAKQAVKAVIKKKK